MPRPSRGAPDTHLSSLRWGRSGCYRPWRWWASGARNSPGPAGPLPGTARPWSARRPHSWPCTARNRGRAIIRGRRVPARPLLRTSPPPRLYSDCWEDDQTLDSSQLWTEGPGLEMQHARAWSMSDEHRGPRACLQVAGSFPGPTQTLGLALETMPFVEGHHPGTLSGALAGENVNKPTSTEAR